MQDTEIGGLKTLIYPGDPERGTVILLHGYGADYRDLAPLSQIIAQIGPWSCVFPDATAAVATSPHTMGKAWFAIDMMQLNLALMGGRDDPFDDITPPGLLAAAEGIRTFLNALGTPPEKTVLGGFSQGSMVALETALSLDEPLAGLALLSCNKTSGQRWSELIKQKGGGLRIFQSHGSHDPVLPIGSALRLSDELQSHAQKHEFHEFRGGHEIPPSVIASLGNFLHEVL